MEFQDLRHRLLSASWPVAGLPESLLPEETGARGFSLSHIVSIIHQQVAKTEACLGYVLELREEDSDNDDREGGKHVHDHNEGDGEEGDDVAG